MKSNLNLLLLFVPMLYILNSCSPNPTEITEVKVALEKTVIYNYSPDELEAMDLINNYRQSIGLKTLGEINYASIKSEEHDNYMIANNVVNHNNFVERSENIKKLTGAKLVSENIAYNYNSAQSVLTAWLNSPAHKDNIEGNFTDFGISIRVNSAGKKYYTNIFVKI
jgi:uncharacterized protein YkwD